MDGARRTVRAQRADRQEARTLSAVESNSGGSTALSGPRSLVGSPAATLSAQPERAAQPLRDTSGRVGESALTGAADRISGDPVPAPQTFLLSELANRNATINKLRKRVRYLEESRAHWKRRALLPRQFCGRGHPQIPENVYVDAYRRRCCRLCRGLAR